MEVSPKFRRNQLVNGFRLEEPLGAGQDGEVWRATRKSIGKSCAIKFLNSAKEPDKKARFDREIQILASLNHPHIVQIQDKGDGWNPDSGDEVPYYVMEFLPGRPIHKALKEMPQDRQLEGLCILFQQVCSALDAAHARGISHGDIKPANILVLVKERIAKVSDFGFGLLPGESKEQRDHYPNSSYKAPETLSPVLADIYRLGRTLTDCLVELPEMTEAVAGHHQIASLATRMSEQPSDISLGEVIAILEQVRTTIRSTGALPEGVLEAVPEEAVPELSPSPDAGRFISDPIHGVRNFSLRAIHIIDLPFFQRLREIRQSPSLELVFPALTISAFEQALGEHSMLIRQLESLGRTAPLREILTPAQLSTTILAGLLLSAARLPFHTALIHALTDEVPLSRRLWQLIRLEASQLIIDEWKIEQPELLQLVEEGERPIYRSEERSDLRLMSGLLHGPLGASALEWVFRMNTRAGFEPAADINDLFRALTISEDGRLVVKEGKLRTLEAFYLARIQTLERLFYQPTIRAANLMLEYAFVLLRRDGLDFGEMTDLNDFEFFNACLKYAKKMKNTGAGDLLTRYKKRILHKRLLSINVREQRFWHYRLQPSERRDAIQRIAERVAVALSSLSGVAIDPSSLLIDSFPYRGRQDLMVLMDDGHLTPASSISPSFAALQDWPNTLNVTLYATREVNEELQPMIRDVHHVVEDVLERVRYEETRIS
jgi:HD superfamily phosphohydrolase